MGSSSTSPRGILEPPAFTPQAETAPTVNQIAGEVVELLADHETYVEPHASGGTLLGMKPESRNEVVNDVHGDLLHLYTTIKDHASELVRFLAESPIDAQLRAEWENSFLRGYRHTDDVVRAAQFFVQFASPSSVTGSVHDDFEPVEDHLQQFKERFDDVLFESKPPHEVMANYEEDSVCMFLNPSFNASRYEYAQRSCDFRFMEHLMEWQGGGVGGEPYWALLTKNAPSPIAMLQTDEFDGNTLTRNYSMELSHATPFVDEHPDGTSVTDLSVFDSGTGMV